MPTFDVPERQLVVYFFDDPYGFRWHHRLLLRHVRDTLWICCTPDLSVQQLNVADHRLVMLARNSAFPADRAAETYACDPIDFTEPVLARVRAEAVAMAEILGGGIAAAAEAPAQAGAVWRISDTSHALFGEAVPPAAVANNDIFVRRESVALVLLDGRWTTAALEQADSSGLAAFKRKFHSGAGRDPRILADRCDSDGRRHLPFVAAISLFAESTFPFWPVDGPRSVKEFLLALR